METDIQRAICDYLALRKVFFFRCNNQPIFDATCKVFRALSKYTMKAIPDTIVVRDGKGQVLERTNGRGPTLPTTILQNVVFQWFHR
jgi:hypothetical protein